jgi:hypothetical protein
VLVSDGQLRVAEGLLEPPHCRLMPVQNLQNLLGGLATLTHNIYSIQPSLLKSVLSPPPPHSTTRNPSARHCDSSAEVSLAKRRDFRLLECRTRAKVVERRGRI